MMRGGVVVVVVVVVVVMGVIKWGLVRYLSL